MFHKYMNKKGSSFLEMILAVVISSFCLVAVINYYSLNIKTGNLRFIELTKNAQINGFRLIKNSLKEGHINTNGVTVSGNSISPKQITYTTTYFSNGNVNEKFSVKCNEKSDGTGTITGKKNDETETVLVDNVSACSFSFYKGNTEATTEATKTRIVKLEIEYHIGKEKKKMQIYEKLMQET